MIVFQKAWLGTTALVLCISTGFAGPAPGLSADRISLLHRKPVLSPRLAHRFSAVVAIGKLDGVPVRNSVSHWVPGATFNNFSKDKNAEFLSWYGFAASYYDDSSKCGISGDGSSICSSTTLVNAIPIIGTGTKVTKIKVPIVSRGNNASALFNVGIYSATASGLPGSDELAGGSTMGGNTNYCCTAVRTIHVDITLNAGRKYFLEVSCVPPSINEGYQCSGAWNMEDTDFSGRAQDYVFKKTRYWYPFTFTYSSPWHLSNYYPEQPAAIVK